MKRDVDKFQRTLETLKSRSESPTIRRNEKIVIRLGKQLKEQNKGYTESALRVRVWKKSVKHKLIFKEFGDQAFLETETYRNELENVSIQIKQFTKKSTNMLKDLFLKP